jgi:hypothetical protein
LGISPISPDDCGVTEIELSTGAWQVTVVAPATLPLVAVIVTAGCGVSAVETQVTRPPETVATPELLEAQLAELVTFCGEP